MIKPEIGIEMPLGRHATEAKIVPPYLLKPCKFTVFGRARLINIGEWLEAINGQAGALAPIRVPGPSRGDTKILNGQQQGSAVEW